MKYKILKQTRAHNGVGVTFLEVIGKEYLEVRFFVGEQLALTKYFKPGPKMANRVEFWANHALSLATLGVTGEGGG